jgi:glutamine synthetase
MLAAGLEGIENKLDPGEPNNTNLYEWSHEQLKEAGIHVLPQNLNEALDALEEDTLLCEAIGSDLAREFLRLKRMEWVEYQRHVSGWEVERYLEFF